jgi:hypothetical protein
VLALALLLGGCAPNAVSTRTDEFTAATTVDGLSASIIPLMGPKIEWRIVSSVGKAPPHDVAHRIVIEVAESDLFSTGEIVDERFHFAADDTATPLKIAQIGAGHCGMSDPKCLKHQTFAIPVTDALLRQRVLRGYRIKIGERERESDILTLSPAMIQQQLSKVDNLVQGETATPAAPPGTPRLGIGVVAATSAPYAAEPRGVIVVVTTPQSPAAAAGVTPGDVLLAIDAQPIRVTGDIARILAGLSQPHAVTLELERAGKPFSATLQL